jgi:flavin-binding protein dodecin
MSVAKIIEISCESPKSFEDAIQDGITRASKTVHNIKSAWVKEQQVVVENGKVAITLVQNSLGRWVIRRCRVLVNGHTHQPLTQGDPP